LHKLHLRLAKLSAAPILMSSQRQAEILREERSRKTWEYSKWQRSWFWLRFLQQVFAVVTVCGPGAPASDQRGIACMRPILRPRWALAEASAGRDGKDRRDISAMDGSGLISITAAHEIIMCG
jgi:hypothetical protein